MSKQYLLSIAKILDWPITCFAFVCETKTVKLLISPPVAAVHKL